MMANKNQFDLDLIFLSLAGLFYLTSWPIFAWGVATAAWVILILATPFYLMSLSSKAATRALISSIQKKAMRTSFVRFVLMYVSQLAVLCVLYAVGYYVTMIAFGALSLLTTSLRLYSLFARV